jgi:hypothetical protein
MNYKQLIEKLHQLGLVNDYDWMGYWQSPGDGRYVIRMNGEEMDPGHVIDLLDSYSELLEQTEVNHELAVTTD